MPDPVKKYKTPNNKIVSSDVLQEKYGDKFTELVNSGKLTEVTEPTYKTPNGLIVEESVLKNKYGEDQFKSLVDDNKFVLDYTPKKKSESQSTTSDTNVVSEAQDTDGSLATPENKTDPQTPNYAATDITTVKEDEPTQQVEGPVYDIDATIKNSVSENKNEIDRNINAINELYQFEDKNKNALEQAEQRAQFNLNYLKDQPKEVIDAYNEFSNLDNLSEEELQEIDTQIANEQKGNYGILSNWWNNVKMNHLNMEDTRKVSKRDDLIKEKKRQKRIDYLNKIDNPELRKKVADIKLKENFRANQSIKDNELLIQQKALEANALIEKIYRLEDNQKAITKALETEKDPEIREQLINEGRKNESLFNQYQSDISTIQNEAEDLYQNIENNFEDISTFDDELDLLKRSYQWLDNQKQILKLGYADVANSAVYQARNFKNNLVNGENIFGGNEDALKANKQEILDDALEFKKETNRQRDLLEPKLQVKDIENVADFAEFMVSSTIENIPTLHQFSLGGAGVVSFGVTQQASESLEIRQGILDDKKRLEEINKTLSDDIALSKLNALQISQLEKQKNNILNKRKLTEFDIVMASSAFAAAEVALGYVGKIRLVNKGKRVAQSVGKSELKTLSDRNIIRSIGKETWDFTKDATGEGFEELGSGTFKNIIEIGYFNDKIDENGNERTFTDGSIDNFVGGFAVGANLSGSTKVFGNTAGIISDKNRRKTVSDNTIKALKLLEKVNDTSLPQSTRDAFEQKAKELFLENDAIINKTHEDWENLSKDEKEKIKSINTEIQGLNITKEKLKSESKVDEDMVSAVDSRLNQIESEKESIINKSKVEKENTTQEAKEETQPTVETTTPETEVKSEKDIEQPQEEIKTSEGIEDTPSPTVELNPENTFKTEDSKLTEKQEEDAEWQSVLGKPLSEIENRLNELEQQEKDVSEGKVEFGPFAEPREIRSTRAVVKKYQSEVSKEDAKRDFKDAFFGNPESYLSDGLKLRESVRVFIEQGGTFKELLSSVKNEFIQDGFSEQDAANVINRKLNAVKSRGLNETQAQGNTVTDGNLQPRVEPSVQQGQDNNTQPTVESTASKTKVEPKGLTENQDKQNKLVDARNAYNKLSKAKKKSPEGQSLLTTVNELSNDLGFKVGEKKGKLSVINNNGKEAGKIALKEQLPESSQSDIDHALSEIDKGVTLWNGDPLSPRVDLGLTRADIRKGEADLKAGKTNTVPAKRLVQALKEAKEKGEYEFIEGSGGKIQRTAVPLTQQLDSETELTVSELEEINQNQEVLAQEYDTWFNGLDETTQNEILEDYENNARTTSQDTKGRESQENVSNEKEAKPTKQERKEIAKAKVDEIVDAINGIDSIFGIKIKIDDVDGINKNGVDIVNLIASIAKQAIDAGIEIDEAIQKTIDYLKTKFSFDVDINEVKKKLQSKSPKNNFKRKPGKKSLANRVYTGKASPELQKTLEKHGLDYEVENQDQAKERAEAFVKSIGLDAAIDALKSGAIKPGAELAFIYSTVIDMMESQSDKATGKQKEKLQQDYAKLQEDIFVQFDNQAREFGRFLSALRKVYDSSYFKYNLSKQIEAHKARNGGEIDAETLAKFKERDAKLKEFEAKIKELETKLEQAEAQQAIDNIQEYNERQKPKPSRSSLKRAATALRKTKFTKSINDLSKLQNDPAGVIKGIWDGAVEIMATALDAGATLETAIKKGINHIKKSDWYKGLKPKNKKIVESKFREDVEGIVNSESIEDDVDVFIDEDGTIKIPAQVIRQLVANGINDIDVLAQTIIDEYLADEDVTLREVRDAITGYGKTINPTQDELSQEISRLKNLGRVLSGMEDVKQGQRPKRSGLQRRKKTDEERRKERELKEAMRDLPLDESDLESKWKTQLDTIKSRLKNQIRDLQEQIDNKERRKPDRQPIEYDQEAKDLIAERDALKQTLDNLVGAPELSYEQKVKLAESAVERSIEKLEESIRLNNLAFKEKTSVTSAKLEALRAKQKALKEELSKMREESGMLEKQQIERRKKAVEKRLKQLQEKRKNKDYSKKERKPLPEDAELRELQRQYRKEKELYDKEAYAEELRNMHPAKKLWKQFVNLLGLQRVLLATGEFSFVFLQNAVPTVNMALRNPVKLANIIAKTVKSYSNTKYEQDYAKMENSDLYDLAVEMRLALTRTNYKLEAKEEAFQSDMVTSAFKLLGQSLDFDGKKKLTLFDTVAKVLGISTKDKQRYSIGEQVENANPFAAMERFTSTYGNHIKMDLFAKGVRKLEAEGKNPIDHKEDYKRLSNAINTLTGRASLGRFDSISPELNALFFSVRFATSTFNKLNPFWYGVVLRDSENPGKPSVAQKMAISQMITYVATTTAFILAVQALGGEDDEGENIVQIETNPTSSDFGKLKIGNIRFDPWGGHMPWVNLISRMVSGEMKKSNGKTVNLGEGDNDTKFDKMVDFAVGKANPTVATGIRFLRASEEIDGVKRDKYGNEVSIEAELKKMYPIYWQGIQEVIKENPEKGKELSYALTALGMLGINNQVYGLGEKYQFKSYAKDVKSELSVKRNQFLRPNDKKVTDQKDLDANFNQFKTLHEQNYDELLDRIKKELGHMKFNDVYRMLKAGGHSEKDINRLLQGQYPEMIKIKDNSISKKLELIEARLKKGEEDKLDIMVKDVLKKAFYYNRKVDEYNYFLYTRGK
jgi:hypothetical protein|tara:strand:+ start:55774 stop:63813 length:8040 start_codon:yes stop_codon:yes gene_type:complete